MAELLETETFASFLDCAVIQERLKQVWRSNGKGGGSYADCEEYIIRHADYYYDEALVKRFGLTDAIRERWDRTGVDFSIHLYLRDGRIAGGHIFKYQKPGRCHSFPPIGYETEPTLQEIRITKRILTYLTSDPSKKGEQYDNKEHRLR